MVPKVSVIIVTLNAEKHISIAMNSFFLQTLNEKELIIVDGASTDCTVKIIERFKQHELRWISEPDKGVYDAMNKGIKIAQGEWLFFLGADDYFLNKNILETVFQNDNNEIDIMYGNVYSVLLKRVYDGPTNNEKLLFSNLCHQSIFYRRQVFEKAGLYKTDYKLFSDWEFNIRCFLHFQFRIKYIPLVISIYAEGGISTVSQDMEFLRNYLFPENLKYLNDRGVKRLRNIKFYDRWWRLLRNMKLKNENDDLDKFTKGQTVPDKILKMYSFQRKIPNKILFSGIFSKIFMSISYLSNR